MQATDCGSNGILGIHDDGGEGACQRGAHKLASLEVNEETYVGEEVLTKDGPWNFGSDEGMGGAEATKIEAVCEGPVSGDAGPIGSAERTS